MSGGALPFTPEDFASEEWGSSLISEHRRNPESTVLGDFNSRVRQTPREVLPTLKDKDGRGVLICAILARNFELADWLLDAGCNPDDPDYRGLHAFHWFATGMASHPLKDEHKTFFEKMYSHSATKKACATSTPDGYGHTDSTLQAAICHENAVLDLLLNHGALPSPSDVEYAIKKDRQECFKSLIQKLPSINLTMVHQWYYLAISSISPSILRNLNTVFFNEEPSACLAKADDFNTQVKKAVITILDSLRTHNTKQFCTILLLLDTCEIWYQPDNLTKHLELVCKRFPKSAESPIPFFWYILSSIDNPADDHEKTKQKNDLREQILSITSTHFSNDLNAYKTMQADIRSGVKASELRIHEEFLYATPQIAPFDPEISRILIEAVKRTPAAGATAGAEAGAGGVVSAGASDLPFRDARGGAGEDGRERTLSL